MVNPVLTIAFDVFLIGSGAAVVAGMIAEYRASRHVAVGGERRLRVQTRTARPRRAHAYRHTAGSRSATQFRRRLAA